MEIIKYNKKYENDVKDLLVQLQEYIALIDDWHLNIMTPLYREVYFKSTLEQCQNGVIFLAIENCKTVGLICGSEIEYDAVDRASYTCPKAAKIYELIVDNTIRNAGIGSKLLNEIENYFKLKGCKYCHVDVFEPNEMAKKFYAKHNYITRMRNLSKKL